MKKLVNYLGCEIYKISGMYYSFGRVYGKTASLSKLFEYIEATAKN